MKENKSQNKEIGARIQQARKAAKLTQMNFAEQIDVSTQYISDLERGVVGASVSTIIKISNVLDVPTDYILRGIDPASGKPVDLLMELETYSPDSQRLLLYGLKIFKKAFRS